MSSDATQSDSLFELLTWLEVNKKRLIVGTVVVAVAGSALAVYTHQQKQAEFKASDALVRLGVGRDTKPTAADYLTVTTQYPNTPAAERALILAAGAFFTEGRHGDAQSRFEQYLKSYPTGAMRPIASLGVAACLDEMNKLDEALAAYQGVVSSYATDPVAHQAKLAMAVLYQARKQPAQAVKIYEELSRIAPPTALNSEARLLLDELIKKHPELAPTNAPVPAGTVQPTFIPPAGASQPKTTQKAPAQAPATKTDKTSPPKTTAPATKP